MLLFSDPQVKNLLKETLSFFGNKKTAVYLVGGYLRDIVLKRRRANPDLDLCLRKGAFASGRSLSRRLKAGFVVLDREHGCCRLVRKKGGRVYTLDLSDWRGATLEEDLLHRDFTINTLAVSLQEALGRGKEGRCWIDLYGARKDIQSGVIRATNPAAFDEDPLRIMRAFSLAAALGFKIEKKTLGLAKAKAAKLKGVSPERIRDELFKILESADSHRYFLMMDERGILEAFMPEIRPMRGLNQGPYHHLDVLRHSLETVRQLDLLLEEWKRRQDIASYLAAPLSTGRRRLGLLKLGAFLHDIGKPRARKRQGRKIKFHGHERGGARLAMEIAIRLKLSNDERRALEKMIFWHLRPGYLGDSDNPSRRAVFRYFRDAGEEAVSVLLLSLADQRATRGPLTSRASRLRHEKVCTALIREYFREKKKQPPVRYLTGDDLIREFGLSPSPLIGRILAGLKESQAIGRINSRRDAVSFVKKYLARPKVKFLISPARM